MSRNSIQDFLNGLLVTSGEHLTFLAKIVLLDHDTQHLEVVVKQLARHVEVSRGSAPAPLLALLRAPHSVNNEQLPVLVRFSGFYRDRAIAEPLTVILRQLSFIAAHPAAVTALAMANEAAAVSTLSQILWSSLPHQWHVREPAILREMGVLGDDKAIKHLIKALGVPYDVPMRAAAQALTHFDHDLLPELVADLTPVASPERVAGISEALGLLNDARAIPHLLSARSRLNNPRVAACVAVALARLNAPGAEDRIVLLSRHQDVNARTRAFQALSLVCRASNEGLASSSIDALFSGVLDAQPEVRAAAAQAISVAKPAAAAQHLIKGLASEVSPLVRVAFIHALGVLGDPAATRPILEVLDSGSPNVQVEALNALALFDDADLVPFILPSFNHPNAKVAVAARKAVKYILRKPFVWPEPQPVTAPLSIGLFSLEDARFLLLPPEPPPRLGFFERLFRAQPEPPPPPASIGELTLTAEGLSLSLNSAPERIVQIDWTRPFVAQITREPISNSQGSTGEIGIHFKLRQRDGSIGVDFRSIEFSLWTTPSEAVGRFPAQSARHPCIDPRNVAGLLAALRFYAQAHGRPIVAQHG